MSFDARIAGRPQLRDEPRIEPLHDVRILRIRSYVPEFPKVNAAGTV